MCDTIYSVIVMNDTGCTTNNESLRKRYKVRKKNMEMGLDLDPPTLSKDFHISLLCIMICPSTPYPLLCIVPEVVQNKCEDPVTYV